jgi:hypothetical protein
MAEEEWESILIWWKKAGNAVIDLDAPLATSGRTTGNKKVKAAIVEAALSERVQSSIDTWKFEISSNSVI